MDHPSVYLDTNIVIRLIEYRDEEVQAFLRSVHARNGMVVSSEVTLAEVLVLPIKDRDHELVAHYEGFLTTGDGIVIVPVGRTVLRRCAELRAEFGGRTPDAIHVASAIEAECQYFLTADRRIRAPTTLEMLDIGTLPDWNTLP
ncbi:type II toxin-antitoxin system VapC family toxin [Aurantimonas sp. C2-6-R+9]|uniref:type II toxin-antitoxin system VapC family toxin n=1 Tax=unclassified Aurantimonas TaxID=2638230 RepID=UPI002E18B4F1|nr:MULTISPECIES: type II toxin-antitoxin system VapC family toxin [unclassified Aurantimonas]MEC5292035.1 type II toxin-antitoxin system VapC family toxin [Aurantimonas sp. C2-3-R2]MEC5325604.1 type II toxin-antitoxin system VapC family toxin [Aurantimonas sp. A3-2-R12]MEC5382211.1 type II toxin-antitoxin system VapC family toxin [Aurantimonas sp. C2-6-R+9]MEC5413147.1 type II toxin-antitoxin system VapC family toxin [Aurantimonas sp. C2-4-R8]